MKYDDLLPERGINLAAFRVPTTAQGPFDLAWLDIEGIKVDAPDTWCQKLRTKAFLVGMGLFTENGFDIRLVTGNETFVTNYVERLAKSRTLVYRATRDYDRMVLEGKWTQVRRPLSEHPGDWPHVTDCFTWQNLNSFPQFHRMNFDLVRSIRGVDVASKLVPEVWGSDPDIVVLHNVRDIIELVLLDNRAPSLVLNRDLYAGNFYRALDILETLNIFLGPLRS